MSEIEVEINRQSDRVRWDDQQCRRAIESICRHAGVQKARLSIAIVDDSESRRLHQRYLAQDSPTDVLSFSLADAAGAVDGEIVINAEMAERRAAEHGWQPADELLLYVVHGALHLVGYDDLSDGERERMFEQQRKVLAELGYDTTMLAKAVRPSLPG